MKRQSTNILMIDSSRTHLHWPSFKKAAHTYRNGLNFGNHHSHCHQCSVVCTAYAKCRSNVFMMTHYTECHYIKGNDAIFWLLHTWGNQQISMVLSANKYISMYIIFQQAFQAMVFSISTLLFG